MNIKYKWCYSLPGAMPRWLPPEPFTFILPCKDLSLFPKIKGGKDVGSNGDIGRRHVLDGGRHAPAAHAASAWLGPYGAGRRHWREGGWCACASERRKKRKNWLITKTSRLQTSCLWNYRPGREVSVCTSQNDNHSYKVQQTGKNALHSVFLDLFHKIQGEGIQQTERITRWRLGILHWA